MSYFIAIVQVLPTSTIAAQTGAAIDAHAGCMTSPLLAKARGIIRPEAELGHALC